MKKPAEKKRILVAEDDEHISSLLVRALSNDYAISVARNGDEALALGTRISPDLLLLDVMMPGLDGMEVSRLVRNLRGLNEVPIIFLTAKDGPQDIAEGLRHGAKHYITKPFKLSDIRDKIKSALED